MTTQQKPNIIAFGYAKKALDRATSDHKRLDRLARATESFHLIIFTRKKEGLATHHSSGRFHVYGTNSRNRFMSVITAIKTARRIYAAQPEIPWIISGQDPFEAGLIAWVFARFNHLNFHVQVHSDFYRNPGWYRYLHNKLRARLGLFLMKRADKVRVVAQRTKDSLVARGVRENAITVLPVYINLDPLLRVGERKVHQTARVAQKFVFLGRVAPEKNIPFIVKAFARIAKENPDVHLTIIGAGPDEERVKTAVEEAHVPQRVSLVPWTNDVAGELSEHDVFLMASHFEGWPLALMEALAVGLPVVTTNVGGIPEVVEHRVNGLLVERDDFDQYCAALKTIVDNPDTFTDMSVAAYKTAVAHARKQREYPEQWAESFTPASV